MSRRRPPRGAPGLVLSCSLLSMTAAGTTYWAPSLAGRLPLTPGDRAVFTAAIGAGYIACVLPGLAATRLGPRAAALLGSVSLCLTYAGIAVVLHTAPHRPLLYLFPLALCISMASYLIYGAAQTAAVDAFSKRRRGAVNGICSAVYALSSGMLGSFEAAFFPSGGGEDTVLRLVLAVAVFSLLPAVCALVAFPADVSGHTCLADRGTHGRGYAALAQGEGGVEEEGDDEGEREAARSLRLGFFAVVGVAAVAQVFAVVDWRGGDAYLLAGLRTEIILAVFMLLFLAGFCLPAVLDRFAGGGSLETGVGEADPDYERVGREEAPLSLTEPPPQQTQAQTILLLAEIMLTPRFVFLFLMLLVIAGCGGLTFLNTVNGLVASRIASDASSPSGQVDVSRGVRALVVVFSAFGVAGRLTAGVAMDNPSCTGLSLSEWRYALLQIVAATLAVAMLICAFARNWLLLVGASLVGFAHGTFFSTGPAVCQDFFGVASFTRNFAVSGVGAGLGASVMAYIASLSSNGRVVSSFGVASSDKAREVVCVGTACYAPPFCLSSVLMLCFLVYSFVMRRRLLFLEK